MTFRFFRGAFELRSEIRGTTAVTLRVVVSAVRPRRDGLQESQRNLRQFRAESAESKRPE